MIIALTDHWTNRNSTVRSGEFPTGTDLSPFVMFAIAYANENHVPQMVLTINGRPAVVINYGTLNYGPLLPPRNSAPRTIGGFQCR